MAEKVRDLLATAADPMVCVDLDGRIVTLNAQAERLLGYRREDLEDQPVQALAPKPLPERPAPGERPTPPGPYGDLLLALRRRDGTEVTAQVDLRPVNTETGLLIAVLIRDLGELGPDAAPHREQGDRANLHGQLQQSQRLESLGELAGGVAHDFNNLIAVILNYAEFVAEELQAAIDRGERGWETAHRDIEQIRRAADRARVLTHQLLAFGRREVVRPRVVNLNSVVREVEGLLQRSIEAHVRLRISLKADLWPILVDTGQIAQVLLNLVINARDAMRAGGTLAIETDNLVVDKAFAAGQPGVRPGRYVRLRVADTGVGMPPEVRARAFEPFFTTKPRGEGTGLGLSTVYGIITQAGGHMKIESEPGRGTEITAILPAVEGTPEEEESAVRVPPRRAGETILVVEDEHAMRDVSRRILERNGYKVLTAGGGAQALDLAKTHAGPIDVLLTDVVMPEMLGRELADQMRHVRPSTRVLYMSGYSGSVLTGRGTLDPGVALVGKPFSEDELVTAVRTALDRDAQSDAG